jgi:hypothetical protein
MSYASDERRPRDNEYTIFVEIPAGWFLINQTLPESLRHPFGDPRLVQEAWVESVDGQKVRIRPRHANYMFLCRRPGARRHVP